MLYLIYRHNVKLVGTEALLAGSRNRSILLRLVFV